MLKDLFDSKVMGIPSVWNELYSSSPFKAYKSVMNISSTGGLSNITSAAIPVKAAPIPVKDSNQKYVISQGTSLGLFNKGTPAQRVAAWKLMIFYHNRKMAFNFSNRLFQLDHSHIIVKLSTYLESDMQSILKFCNLNVQFK